MCYPTEYLFSVRTDVLISERMTFSQTEYRFSIRNKYFVQTLYIRPDCLFPIRMTPDMIDYPYEWLPERMIQVCVFTYADHLPNRLSILRTNGWPIPGQNIYSPYERMTPFPNGWPVNKHNLYSLYEIHTSYGLYTRVKPIKTTKKWHNIPALAWSLLCT